jgi:WD40 repeat protein
MYDIRVWNAAVRQELLRIQVPNLECKCVGITENGGTIVSGWTDGKLRAFYPESGRLKFVITDAHTDAATALAVCHMDDSLPPWRMLSGGADGRVRVWSITSSHQSLVHSFKEHRGPVTALSVASDNMQGVSASADGSCIIWDLERMVRMLALFEPTVFQAVLYHPDESQLLTCGSNHKISYWDAYDASAIRVIDGADAEMSAIDIDSSGEIFVSGSADKTVKVWSYDDGIATAVGTGHSGRISKVKISPDMKTICSVGAEGAIFLWSL